MIDFEEFMPFLCGVGDEINIEGTLWVSEFGCEVIGHQDGQPVLYRVDGPGLNSGELILKPEPEGLVEAGVLSQYKQVHLKNLVGKKITHHSNCWPGFLLICEDKSYVKLEPYQDDGCIELDSCKLTFQDLCDLNLVDEETLQKATAKKIKKASISAKVSGERKLLAAINLLGDDRVQEIIVRRAETGNNHDRL